jgi:hypothetical protein
VFSDAFSDLKGEGRWSLKKIWKFRHCDLTGAITIAKSVSGELFSRSQHILSLTHFPLWGSGITLIKAPGGHPRRVIDSSIAYFRPRCLFSY